MTQTAVKRITQREGRPGANATEIYAAPFLCSAKVAACHFASLSISGNPIA